MCSAAANDEDDASHHAAPPARHDERDAVLTARPDPAFGFGRASRLPSNPPLFHLKNFMATHNRASARRNVTIVGAGIIGVSCAVALQRAGCDVTLVDREEPGEGCSSGNAGILANYGMVPLSTPGILGKVPGMLLDPLGPLSIRWGYLPRMVSWLYRFWRASNEREVTAIAGALTSLLRSTVDDHLAATAGTGAESWVRPSPLLCVYPDEKAFQQDAYVWRMRQAHGTRISLLRGNEVKSFEPAISSAYQFAVVLDECGYVLDPKQLVKALSNHVVRHGGRILHRDITDAVVGASGVTHLVTDSGLLDIDILAVCAGAWSGHLARRLGSPVPLESERGYHIMLRPQQGLVPRYPVMSPSQKIIATPMQQGLRLAGQVEFGGLDASPDYRRAEALAKHATRLFPGVETAGFTQWMGHRPSLPDSLPVIGRSPHLSNVYYAFGHHHVGLTAGPMTGRLIAELVTQRTASIDLTPFRINRF